MSKAHSQMLFLNSSFFMKVPVKASILSARMKPNRPPIKKLFEDAPTIDNGSEITIAANERILFFLILSVNILMLLIVLN